MKISELTTENLCLFLRENPQELSDAEVLLIESLRDAAVSYVMKRCNIGGVSSPDEHGRMLDDYEDITIAVQALVSDMYDNRQMTVDGKYENRVAESILGLHDFNLVPSSGELS